MPLIYGPTEMTNPQPKNFVTPSRTTGIYVQNVSPLALIITSGLGSIELPPWQTATLEAMPNDNLNVSAIPITAVPPSLAAYAYVDISYTFQGVTVQGSGLFFPFMTPGGDAVAAGIMGPDGLQVGTSTSNPNNSSLLTQLTGSNVPHRTDLVVTTSTVPVTLTSTSATASFNFTSPITGATIKRLNVWLDTGSVAAGTTPTISAALQVAIPLPEGSYTQAVLCQFASSSTLPTANRPNVWNAYDADTFAIQNKGTFSFPGQFTSAGGNSYQNPAAVMLPAIALDIQIDTTGTSLTINDVALVIEWD